MLDQWFVLFVEGIFFANTTVFAILELVVTAFLVLALEFIDKWLLNSDLRLLFWRDFILSYTKVNLRLKTSNIVIEALFTRDPMMRVELVKGVLQQLVSAVKHHNGKRQRLHRLVSDWILNTKRLFIFIVRFLNRLLKQPPRSFFVFYLWHIHRPL